MKNIETFKFHDETGKKYKAKCKGTNVWSVDFDSEENKYAVFHQHPEIYSKENVHFYFYVEQKEDGTFVCIGPKCQRHAPEEVIVMSKSLNIMELLTK